MAPIITAIALFVLASGALAVRPNMRYGNRFLQPEPNLDKSSYTCDVGAAGFANTPESFKTMCTANATVKSLEAYAASWKSRTAKKVALGLVKAAASIALEGIDGVAAIGGTFTDMAKVSDLAGQVAADEFLVWMQEQAISTGKALLPEEATDKIIEATFSKLTESKKGLLPQSGTQALQPDEVAAINKVKNTFMYALLLLRSTQVKAALEYFAEGTARPLNAVEQAQVLAFAADLPTDATHRAFLDALSLTELSKKNMAGRMAARLALTTALDWGLTIGTFGVSKVVNFALKLGNLPSTGGFVVDKLIRSPGTARNVAIIAHFVKQYKAITSALAPMWSARPCGLGAKGTGDNVRTVVKAPSGDNALAKWLATRARNGMARWGCRRFAAVNTMLQNAIDDAKLLAWLAYDSAAESAFGPMHELKVLVEISAQASQVASLDPELTTRVDEVKQDVPMRLLPQKWLKSPISNGIFNNKYKEFDFFISCIPAGTYAGAVELAWQDSNVNENTGKVSYTLTPEHISALPADVRPVGTKDSLKPKPCDKCKDAKSSCVCVPLNDLSRKDYKTVILNLATANVGAGKTATDVFMEEFDIVYNACTQLVATAKTEMEASRLAREAEARAKAAAAAKAAADKAKVEAVVAALKSSGNSALERLKKAWKAARTPATTTTRKATTPVTATTGKATTPVTATTGKVTTPVTATTGKATTPVTATPGKVTTPVTATTGKQTTPVTSTGKATTPVTTTTGKPTTPVTSTGKTTTPATTKPATVKPPGLPIKKL